MDEDGAGRRLEEEGTAFNITDNPDANITLSDELDEFINERTPANQKLNNA